MVKWLRLKKSKKMHVLFAENIANHQYSLAENFNEADVNVTQLNVCE